MEGLITDVTAQDYAGNARRKSPPPFAKKRGQGDFLGLIPAYGV